MAGSGFCRLLVGVGVLAALVGAPLTVAGLAAGPAGALTTISVTSPTDAALRAAFTTANATADDVEIDINVGSATITLTGGELSYTGGSGSNHALTVKGNGATIDQTTVGARVLHSTSSNTNPLTLDGMTITGGNGTAGPAVFDTHGLVISNSTVSGNTSSVDIIATGTNPTTITNSTISNNTVTGATDCSGILDTFVTNIVASTIANNRCIATTGSAQGIVFPTGLTITGSVIQNNTNTSTSGDANGILDSDATTIGGSAIVGNTNSTTSGNAFGTVFPTTLTMTNSTVANNTNSTGTGSAFGAGIDVGSQNLSVTNSTIANNTNSGGTASKGGGIFQGSTGIDSAAANTTKHGAAKGGGVGASATVSTTLVYVTVAGNSATTGANIDATTLVSFGSVVALHPGGVNCVLTNTTTSNGFNFSDDISCGFTAGTDHQNAGDPGLGPVANNGGPAPTRLPLPGSPLIDAIPVASCQADGAAGITTDERGVARPQGNGCDIGAVEVVPAVLVTPRFTG